MKEKSNHEQNNMYSLGEFKKVFDPLLEEDLSQKIENFNSLTTNTFIKDFISHTERLFSGGKRLRPYLAYSMYKAYGGKDDEKAMKLFVSLETIHLFALVHDDIMDKADLRRNEKTIHKFVLERLEGFGDLPHTANSQAILVGDLLMSWSLDDFKNDGFDKENFDNARDYFYKMIDEVILGQMLDVDITTKDIASEEEINEKTRLKTSRYTCVRPMQIGAALANKDYNQEEFLEELGTKVGVAFQLQDDLLAIVGTSEALTKDILIDVEEHQHTFFTNFLFEHGSQEQIEEFKKYFGKQLNDDEKDKVKNLFIKSGAINAGKELITKMLNQARQLVNNSNFEEVYKQEMEDLFSLMEKRQS